MPPIGYPTTSVTPWTPLPSHLRATVADVSRARKIWVAAGAGVLLALTGYLVITGTHQLEHGNFWNVGEGAVFDRVDPDVAIHELRAGSNVRIAVTVRNPERIPAVLSEVSVDSTDIAVDEVTMIELPLRNPQACCSPEHAESFHPVVLHRGDEVAVWLALHLTGANQYSPGSGFTLGAVTIRFRVLGMPRTQWLPLGTGIMFRAPSK